MRTRIPCIYALVRYNYAHVYNTDTKGAGPSAGRSAGHSCCTQRNSQHPLNNQLRAAVSSIIHSQTAFCYTNYKDIYIN